MKKQLSEAIEMLADFEKNGNRIAKSSKAIARLLLKLQKTKDEATAADVITDINDYLQNLPWNADLDLNVGETNDEGCTDVNVAVTAAIGAIKPKVRK